MSRKVLCHDSKDWTYEYDIFKNGTLQNSSMTVKKRGISSVESEKDVFEHFRTLSLSPKPLTFLVYKSEDNDGENNNSSSQNNNNSSQINHNNSSPFNDDNLVRVINKNSSQINNNSILENTIRGENIKISPSKLTRPPFNFLPAADESKAPSLRRPSLSFLQKNSPAGGQQRGTPDGENTLAPSGIREEDNWRTITIQNAAPKENSPPKLRRPSLQFVRNASVAIHDDKNGNLTGKLESRPIWRRVVTTDQRKKFTLCSNLDTEISRIRDTFSRKKIEDPAKHGGLDSSGLSIGCGNSEIGAIPSEEVYIPPYRRNVKAVEIQEIVSPVKSVDCSSTNDKALVKSPTLTDLNSTNEEFSLQQKRFSISPEVKIPFKRGNTQARPQKTFSRGSPKNRNYHQRGEKRHAQAAQERLQKIKIELANC